MKELFREADFSVVGFFQSLLEGKGIRTHIRNESLVGFSEIPIPEFFPALCVVNDEDYDRAMSIIRSHNPTDKTAREEDIVCQDCGEESPGNFEVCWNCERVLSGEES